MKKKILIREILYLSIFLLLAFLFFYKNLTFSYLRTDDTIQWEYMRLKDAIQEGTPYVWNNLYFKLPSSSTVIIHPRTILLALLPISVFIQSSIIFHIFIFGYGMFLFLRKKKLSLGASMFGAIALMFTNNFVTLVMAGHLGKFETYAYFPLVLYFLSLAVDKGRIKYFIFTGGMLGIAFMGGALDVASYFAVFVGIYFLYLLFKKKNDNSLKYYIKKDYKIILFTSIKFLIVIVFSFTISLQVIMHTRAMQDQGAAGVRNERQLWDWATRWSYPPEELLAFILPGFFGDYSYSPTSPYWGRIARMEGDEPTFNYSLVITNISVIAFMFILFALISSHKKYKEKHFWIASSIIFLLASFGRYFPLIYKIIFSIPIFQSARNPNKFLDVAVIPIAVLAAYGADYLFNIYKAKKDNTIMTLFGEDNQYKKTTIVKYIIYSMTVLGVFLTLGSLLFKSSIYSLFALSWGHDAAELISKNIFLSFLRFTFLSTSISLIVKNVLSLRNIRATEKHIVFLPIFLFIMSSIFIGDKTYNIALLIFTLLIFFLYLYLDNTKKFNVNILVLVCSAILVLDLWESASAFIQKSEMRDFYKGNRITDIIKNGSVDDNNNLVMPLPNNYINVYMTHTFPAFKIRLVDPPAASRMDKNIENFFSAFAINDYYRYQPRLYSMLGVKYFLSPGDISMSAFYNDLKFIDMYQDNYSVAYLYEIKDSADRFEYITKTYKANNFDEAIGIITSSDFNYRNEAVVYDEGYEYLNSNINDAINYSAKIVEETANLIKVDVETYDKGILLLKDFYNEDWIVSVNGEEKPLLKINTIFRGVALDKGDFEIIYKYEPSLLYFYITLLSFLILFVFAIINIILYMKRSDKKI